MKFIKNEKDKVMTCDATQMRGGKTFQVMTYNSQHTCGRVFKKDNHMSRYLRNNYVNHFRNNSKLCIGAFINIVRNSLACEVSPSQAYRTKKKALKQIHGT